MKTKNQHLLVLIFLLLLSAGNSYAQQFTWPENWLISPKGMGEKVFRLDEDAASGSRVLRVATNNNVGNLMINFDMPLTEQTTLQCLRRI
jgi:hypothetical protein